jgi:pilus assembly protein Flp/PilA
MFGRLVQSSVLFLKREDGPTAAEYAIMLALIMAVIITVSGIGATTKSSYENSSLQSSVGPAGS